VVTPDATVVVHGTVFSVSFDRDTKKSCVAVEEGVVSVRHASGKTWLEAGDSWGCEQPTPTSMNRSTPATRPSAPSPRAGTLAAENALFESAIAADRRGNRAEAQAKLRSLLEKYPESPLAPEARATLARLQQH
jgi:ferric-dicitrate binding protein FerR (iron transport regulator)